MVSSSASRGTWIGSPATIASFVNGRLMVKRLQVGSATKRPVAIASGTMGRPDMRPSMTMPMPATRAGPGGMSVVIATVMFWRKALSAALSAEAPPRSLPFSLAPAPRISPMSKFRSVRPIISPSEWRATMLLT